jgi:hypothetical protein
LMRSCGYPQPYVACSDTMVMKHKATEPPCCGADNTPVPALTGYNITL